MCSTISNSSNPQQLHTTATTTLSFLTITCSFCGQIVSAYIVSALSNNELLPPTEAFQIGICTFNHYYPSYTTPSYSTL